MGGTDHCWLDGPREYVPDPDEDARYADRLLAQERAEDARYAIKAWAKAVPWLALCGSIGAAFTAISKGDYLALCGYLTAIVLVFWPRLNPRFIFEIFRTELIRRNLLALPANESTINPLSTHQESTIR